MNRRRLHVIVAAFVFLTVGFVLFQRYTSYGIFVAGGGKYWVERAASTKDEKQAKAHLRRTVAATQYGVNVAETAVAELRSRDDRVRLWRYLVEIAPNENWRGIYAGRLLAEQ